MCSLCKKDFLTHAECAKLINKLNGNLKDTAKYKGCFARLFGGGANAGFVQEKSLREFCSNSLAVVRISTVRLFDGRVEVIGNPTFRINSGKDVLLQRIHMISGKLCGSLCSEKSGKVVEYFDDKVPPNGYEIPFWTQIKQLVIATADKFSEINFMRWDVIISENGPQIANASITPRDFLDEQILMLNERHHGIKTYYTLLYRYFLFCKRSDDYWVEKLNSELMFQEDDTMSPPDFVVVLGSNNCLYKALKAVEKFSCFENVIYIPTGGNYSKNIYEYEVLNNALLQAGIPSERIILETSATVTAENITNSTEIITRYCNEHDIKNPKVTIVASWFHSKRTYNIAESIMKGFRINIVTAIGTYTKPDNWYNSFEGFFTIVREFYKIADKDLINLFNNEFKY